MTSYDRQERGSPMITGRREQYATRGVFLCAGMAMAVWAPLVPLAQARVGVDAAGLGALLLCLGLGSMIAMPVTGLVVNRFGCRAVIAVALIVLAAILPALSLADTPVTLAVALAIFGASIGTVDVAMNVQAVMVEDDSGRSMMSGFHGLFSLGGILGAGGVSLALGAGLSPTFASLAVSAILIVLLLSSYTGVLPYGTREAGHAPLFAWPKGSIVILGLMCFVIFLSEGAVLDWSALFLTSAHGAREAVAGLGYTMFAVTMTAGRFAGDRIVRTLGGPRVVFMGGMLSGAGFLLAVYAPSQTLALAGFALVGLGASNIVPVFFTVAGRQTVMPTSLAIAAMTTLGYAGILLGPALIGLVASAASLAVALVMLALLVFGVAILGPSAVRKG